MNDLATLVAMFDLGDERTIYLKRTNREAMQIVERGIASAKVVQTNRDPETGEILQYLAGLRRVLHGQIFRHFQLEKARLQANLLKYLSHALHEIPRFKLPGCTIDAHGSWVGWCKSSIPSLHLPTRIAHDPSADRQ